LVLRSYPPTTSNSERLYFGSAHPESPFKDDRVRIAYMKTIDRDAFINVAYNKDKFETAGLPITTGWEGCFSFSVWDGWYVDPKSKDFGSNAKNFEYNIADAKALVEATGAKTPLEFTQNYAAPAPTSFPAIYYTRADVYMGMVENSGVFKMNRNLMSWQSEWNTPRYRFSKGNFNGTSWGPDVTGGDATYNAFFFYNTKGTAYWGADAKLEQLTVDARREFDEKKRIGIVHEIQRYNGGKMYNEKIGGGSGFFLMWPVVRNVLTSRNGTNWMDIEIFANSGLKSFLDPSQAPLKKA
jgi:ABC-type transport system substrate-binding protein